MPPDEMCHCGRPLHYADPVIESMVRYLISQLGEYIEMTVAGHTWLVQRHYIALHGVKGSELASLGFPEVTNLGKEVS